VSAKLDIDTNATLARVVQDHLERMTPAERVRFLNAATRGYCMECGEREPHGVCPFMVEHTYAAEHKG
jgi:hypothetical protein